MRFKPLSLYLLLLCFSLSALAESAQPVKVATFSFPPFIVSDSDGLLSGSAIDAAKKVFDQANLKPIYLAKPWNRAVRSVQSGEVELILPFFFSAARSELFHYTHLPFIQFKVVLFRRSQQPFLFNGDLNKLVGLRISRIRNVSTSPAFDSMVNDGLIELIDAETITQQMRQLVSGRADLAVGVDGTHLAALANSPYQDKVAVVETPIGVRDAYIATLRSQTSQQLIQKLDRAVEQLPVTADQP